MNLVHQLQLLNSIQIGVRYNEFVPIAINQIDKIDKLDKKVRYTMHMFRTLMQVEKPYIHKFHQIVLSNLDCSDVQPTDITIFMQGIKHNLFAKEITVSMLFHLFERAPDILSLFLLYRYKFDFEEMLQRLVYLELQNHESKTTSNSTETFDVVGMLKLVNKYQAHELQQAYVVILFVLKLSHSSYMKTYYPTFYNFFNPFIADCKQQIKSSLTLFRCSGPHFMVQSYLGF